jgi:hypothetical protein
MAINYFVHYAGDKTGRGILPGPRNLDVNGLLELASEVARCRVAYIPNTPPETLTVLARDKIFSVRRCVERNPNATREVIQTVRAYEFYKEQSTL